MYVSGSEETQSLRLQFYKVEFLKRTSDSIDDVLQEAKTARNISVFIFSKIPPELKSVKMKSFQYT